MSALGRLLAATSQGLECCLGGAHQVAPSLSVVIRSTGPAPLHPLEVTDCLKMCMVTSPLVNHMPSLLPAGDRLLSTIVPCPPLVLQAACAEPSPVTSFSPQLSVQFSRSFVSDSLRPCRPQHTRLACLSPTPRDCSNSCPSSH